MKTSGLFASLTCAGLLLGTPKGTTATAEATAVLEAPTPVVTGGSSSFAAAISADARHVLFLSRANNLVTNDGLNNIMDVFLRDRVLGRTTLISTGLSGGGSDNSATPSISADGRWVAFESEATNLVPDDTNRATDIFLRDLAGDRTIKVSTAPNGERANGRSENPQISEDGRFVLFESTAGNLVDGQTNSTREIFQFDRVTGLHRQLSTDRLFPDRVIPTHGPAHSASQTTDARHMVYVRSTTNSVGRMVSGEILAWDGLTSNTFWISGGIIDNNQTGILAFCSSPVLSADGRYVVFLERTGTNGGVSLYRRANPPEAGVPAERITASAAPRVLPSVSADGRFIAYEALDGIHLWDAQTANDRLVLENLPSPNRRVASRPALSADGEHLAFLVTSNDFVSIQLYNRLSDATILAVARPNSTPAPVNGAQPPLFSADGQSIVFDSTDDTLIDGDRNRASDVFAVVLKSRIIDCVSLRADARPSVTPPTPSYRWPGSINANGRVIAVSSHDQGGADTNRQTDLYVRQLPNGPAQFLGGPTNSTSHPSLSADGRYLTYLSMNLQGYLIWLTTPPAAVWRRDLWTGADLLIHPASFAEPAAPTAAISPDGMKVAFIDQSTLWPSSSSAQLYLRNIPAGTVTLVSAQPEVPGVPQSPANGACTAPRFSPDGRWLFFLSTAQNLTLLPVNSGFGLYGRDLLTQKTVLLSSTPAPRYELAISADSRRLASFNSTVNGVEISIFDLESNTAIAVPNTSNARSLSLSATGRWLATEDNAPVVGWRNIYVHDLAAQTRELISPRFGTTNDPSVGPSSSPSLSPDGRYVVFASLSSNLVPGDANAGSDIFIRDRWRHATVLASVNLAGTGPGNGPSILPILSADGRTVLFHSAASDLIENDYNDGTDVFILHLSGPDTDGDGMEDDWELAYFSALTRDGKGDLDADGTTDAVEYQLGTDPTNTGSVFQVMTLTRANGQGTRVLWSAAPGRAYRVQSRDDLSSSVWTDLSEPVTAAGTTATWTDFRLPSSKAQFYRVVLLPPG